MSEDKENFLSDLAKQFRIAQNVPASEHIKLLKNLEKLDKETLTFILNYFITIEINVEVLIFLIKMVSKCYNDLTLDIIADMLLSKKYDNSETGDLLKCEIVNTLGRAGNPDFVIPVLYLLNNKNENYRVRLACAEALGRIGSSYAVTPLISVVTDNEEKSMYLRESAAKALGMLGDMRAIEPLTNILESRNGLFDKFTFLKERIIETLGRLGQSGDAKSMRALKNALSDDASCVRIGAIEALSEIDDDAVIPLIEGMLNDKDEEVAKAAVFALYEILGSGYLKELVITRPLNNSCKEEIRELLLEEENDEVNNEG